MVFSILIVSVDGEAASIGWVKVCEGMLPEGTSGGAVRALPLPGSADALVVGGGESISVLKFKNQMNWEIVTRIDCRRRKHVAWSTGDALNSKGAQLVVYTDGAISVYDIGASVQVYSHEIPDTMLTLAIGDVDSDGACEIISLCTARAADPASSAYRIVVARIDETGYSILWEDRGSFGIGGVDETGARPTVYVADLLNEGASRIIVEETQSDVSPSRFLVYAWKDGALEKDQELSFEGIPLAMTECAPGAKVIEYFLMGPIAPRKAGTVQFLGALIGPSANGGVFLMEIESLGITVLEKCFDEWMIGRTAWANLDGACTGVARVWQAPGYPRAQYAYYRKVVSGSR